jgi:sodium transport system ATP-binding protein
MIEAKNLSKHFGPVKAVQDVSFIARDGQITGLLGPNGAGKSTCLRLVYGVLEADAGVSLIDGMDIAGETSAARARLGVLPHATGLYGNLTARENIAYFGALQGLDARQSATRIEQLAHSLDMTGFIDRRAKGFSQGQRVKTALARALIHAPRNLVLDEPTNGLDVMAIRTLRGLLVALRNAGHCILFSSHVMQEIAALCDRVVIIGGGRLLADDAPLTICERMQTESFEDAFLGVLRSAQGIL